MMQMNNAPLKFPDIWLIFLLIFRTFLRQLLARSIAYSTVYICLFTIGALWLMDTQNITYKIQLNGKGFAYYTEHIV